MGEHCTPQIAEEARRRDLAVKAYQIMMRRGWGVVQVNGQWFPAIPTTDDLSELRQLRWSDPFTAVVEADIFYREHVEPKIRQS